MHENAKRRQSDIRRGLGVSSLSVIAFSFTSLTERMFGRKVELSDVVPITNPHLHQAKILNEEHRRLIPTSTKYHSDIGYRQIFILYLQTLSQQVRQKKVQSPLQWYKDLSAYRPPSLICSGSYCGSYF